MTEAEKKNVKFIPPLRTAENDMVEPLVFEADGKKFKVYVEKVGYSWEMSGSSGLAERVRISLAKLDQNDDVAGAKKQINLPSCFSKENFQAIFKNIMAVKDKPLVENKEKVAAQ